MANDVCISDPVPVREVSPRDMTKGALALRLMPALLELRLGGHTYREIFREALELAEVIQDELERREER